MKSKNLILILAAGFLIVPAFCFAGYTRTPSDYTILNPITFHFWDVYAYYPGAVSWKAEYILNYSTTIASDCFTSADQTDIQSLPLGEYSWVRARIFFALDCSDALGHDIKSYEGTGEDIIFEVIAPPPPPETKIITIKGDTPAEILAYAGELFTDTNGLIFLAIGLPLGFWIISKVRNLVTTVATTEEKEFKKVEKMVKEKKADQLGMWLDRYGKKGDFWNEPRSKKDDWL